MSKITFAEDAWEEYLYWQSQDKKTRNYTGEATTPAVIPLFYKERTKVSFRLTSFIDFS